MRSSAGVTDAPRPPLRFTWQDTLLYRDVVSRQLRIPQLAKLFVRSIVFFGRRSIEPFRCNFSPIVHTEAGKELELVS